MVRQAARCWEPRRMAAWSPGDLHALLVVGRSLLVLRSAHEALDPMCRLCSTAYRMLNGCQHHVVVADDLGEKRRKGELCSHFLSGAGCTTLHKDRRLADRLRARRPLRNKFSKLARLRNETIVRNRFPSLSTAARKRWCTSTTLRFLLDGPFCLISHDFNRACRCARASLELSSSKTRKALRTRHIGSALRSVSGS